MNKEQELIIIVIGSSLATGIPFPTLSPKRRKPLGACINCGGPKRHNNSFCSKECCEAHKIRATARRA